MRFTKPFWDGIADGSVTVAFRNWKSPTVVAGRAYRTGGGRIEVLTVDAVDPSSISETDAGRAGHESAAQVRQALPSGEDRRLYRVEFRRLDEPDPRELLAEQSELDQDDIAEIAERLARYDRASSFGPWTAKTLELIERHPARRAPDLADMFGRETKPFKLDVRKLKNLGLTRSLRIGYELSPRGLAYLEGVTGGSA